MDSLTQERKDFLSPLIKSLLEDDDSDAIQTLWEADYFEKPVDVVKFLTHQDYLGNYGDVIYDKWLEELWTVFDERKPIIEWVLTGPIGGGKSFAACAAIMYQMYRLRCMKRPQEFYGLSKNSKIAFGLFNTSLAAAKAVAYGYIRGGIMGSPWFNKYQVWESRLGLYIGDTLHIYPASNIRHALGMNMFGGLLDELNFLKQSDKYNAYNIYVQTKRRMTSRYMKLGKTPGLLCMVSSKKDMTDFLEEHIKANMGSETFHLSDFPLWDLKPDRYCGKKFTVIIGDLYHSSRIVDKVDMKDPIEKTEVTPGTFGPGDNVLQVPVEHYPEFKQDADGALRDIAGKATYSISPLIPNREAVSECETDTIQHPFTRRELAIGLYDGNSIDSFFTPSMLVSDHRMLRHPEEYRFGHIDIGLTGDALGFSVAHLGGMREVVKLDAVGKTYTVYLPVVEVDFMIRITSPPNSEIDLTKVLEFILYLRRSGMPLLQITLDGYQSRHLRQLLIKNDVVSEIQSVDRDDVPYVFLKNTILDKRLFLYHYAWFFSETINLVHEIKRKKVDHPDYMVFTDGSIVKGSKDVADSVTGAVYAVLTEYERKMEKDFHKFNDPMVYKEKDALGSGGWVTSGYSASRKIDLRRPR